MFSTDNIILLFSILLIAGVFTTKFSSRIGLPALVFFLAVGMILSNFVYFDSAEITQLFGILALIVILFEGGLQTKWQNIKPVMAPSLSLATAGVLVTTIVVGVCAKFILGVSWWEGMLFGAIVGSTDAAAVFAVIGSKNIQAKLTTTLEAESGTNDPMAVFLTISIIHLLQSADSNIFFIVLNFFWQMGFGLVAGYLIGKLAVLIINRINLESSGLYPVLSLAFAVFTYSSTALLNGSGLLAVYIMALVVGNSDLTYRTSIFKFNEGFAWMAQILMFILLGLLVFPNQLLAIAWQGLALSVILMLVARPIGVFFSIPWMGFSFKDKLLISWCGLKGAVPIVLATYPLIAGLEIGPLFFNVVFFVVLTSALIQGSTISPLANRLGLSSGEKKVSPHSLELVSMGRTNTEMLEVHVEEHSSLIGKELREWKLPEDTLVTAIIRGEKLLTPRGSSTIQADDILYIILSKSEREKVKQIIQSPPAPDMG